MDTPEQPPVWPPAPSLAPPKAEQGRPNKVRAWLASALKLTGEAALVLCDIEAAITLLWPVVWHKSPHYTFDLKMLVMGFVVFGLVKWRKLTLKRRQTNL